MRGRGIDTPRLQYFFLHRVFVVVTNSYHKKHNVSCRVRTGDLVRWFSGRMLACHAGGPGSIPGRCKHFFCHVYAKTSKRTQRGFKKQKCAGDGGYRSPYLSHAKRALYHLSYVPIHTCKPVLTGPHSDFDFRVERECPGSSVGRALGF